MYGFTQLFDENINVITAPVSYICEPSAILLELFLIGNGKSCDGIRIEIIVYMQPIYVVTAHNIVHNLAYIITIFGQTGI